MGLFIRRIAKLLNVKTIVTFVITYVFARLALSGDIEPDVAMPIITMVMAFYFGTQHMKPDDGKPPDPDEQGRKQAYDKLP